MPSIKDSYYKGVVPSSTGYIRVPDQDIIHPKLKSSYFQPYELNLK